MKNNLKYKGYNVTVDYFDKLYFGEVVGVKPTLYFEGDSLESLFIDFKAVIDDYLYSKEI